MPSSKQDGAAYLLVFGEGSSLFVPLPTAGACTIGSDPLSDVSLDEPSVLARHAAIEMTDHGAILFPFGVPTLVNDNPISGEHPLRSGDIVCVGSVSLRYHGPASGSKSLKALGPDPMRRRLLEETERFLRYGRPLAVMVLLAKPKDAKNEEQFLAAAAAAVRVVDVMAWDGRQELWILFPETSDTAMVPAERVLASVSKAVRGATAGIARCPHDGIDPEGLVAGARLAAQQAEAGCVIAVSEADHQLTLGALRITVADPLMRNLFELVERIASSEIPVLIMGETGAGKEIVAQAVHAWSKRADKRMVSINCAAVSETLLESELFGHEKGAFTGAASAKAGLFEEASGGTVFLDEIGECAPRTQAELLRVLETKRFCRVGSLRERSTDVRIIAATNRSLDDEIKAGRFRQDLYFRLNTATVTVPPLRDRPLDLLVLARAFLKAGCEREKRELMQLSMDAMQRIALHDWPGNVREIRNLMDFLTATVKGTLIEAKHLPPSVAAKAAPWMLPKRTEPPTEAASARPPAPLAFQPTPPGDRARRKFRNIQDEIRELEKTRIQEALEEAGGVRNRAAELIGMPLRTMVTKIKAYGLAPAPPRRSKT